MTDATNNPSGNVPSPCVRNCCLDASDICLGCHRSIAEIIGWHKAMESEKREILARCRVREKQRLDRLAARFDYARRLRNNP